MNRNWLQRLIDNWRIRRDLKKQAKRRGFPMVIQRYMFAAAIGHRLNQRVWWAWQKKWQPEELPEKDTLYALEISEAFVGVYRCVQKWKSRGVGIMSDLAGGDPGMDGEFVLVRIDYISPEDLEK